MIYRVGVEREILVSRVDLTGQLLAVMENHTGDRRTRGEMLQCDQVGLANMLVYLIEGAGEGQF